MTRLTLITATLTATGLLAILAGSTGQAATFDLSLRHEAEQAIARGLDYLAGSQKDNGSWSDYPGVTGLALTAMMRAPKSLQEKHAATIEAGYKYLLSNVHDDGGIYPPFDPKLEAYNTSIALMALTTADAPAFEDHIRRARDYLFRLQADEEEGLSPDSSTYGGIGYNSDERSDISNMQFALEALRTSEDYDLNPDDQLVAMDDSAGQAVDAETKRLFWEKAITFLQRCQNYKAYNDYEWSSNDGGFVYYPGVSKAGGTTSYGGMTYAGLKSFIHAGLDIDDPRVQAAYDWIRGNYTVEENPELGQQGLFYYYHVMAKSLTLIGDSVLVDTSGVSHDWRGDLTDRLLRIQKADGSWVNENGRWWENNPDLVTAYSTMALQELLL